MENTQLFGEKPCLKVLTFYNFYKRLTDRVQKYTPQPFPIEIYSWTSMKFKYSIQHGSLPKLSKINNLTCIAIFLPYLIKWNSELPQIRKIMQRVEEWEEKKNLRQT